MSATPTVYFIDDSATMREVIKIAFRRENINVVACQDAGSALIEIEKARPDVVITDVIMPEKDGYDVCQFIKNHPALSRTPVILMSGVVNRAVAEKAFSVKADELLRKPFQPQDLIARVKHLLNPGAAPTPGSASPASAAVALSSIFTTAPTPQAQPRPAAPGSQSVSVLTPRAVPPASAPATAVAAAPAPAPVPSMAPLPVPAPASAPVAAPLQMPSPPPSVSPASVASVPAASPATASAATSASVIANDPAKLKVEVLRLEGLVKKLQSELQAEREYSRALEAHVKTLQEAE